MNNDHSPCMSRRHVLGAAGLVTAAAGFSIFSPAVAHALDDFDIMLTRYAELLAGAQDADTSSPAIQDKLRSMDDRTTTLLSMVVAGQDRDRVFSDLPLAQLTKSHNIQETALKLSSMAQCWSAPGTAHHHDPEVGEAVIDGLRTLHRLAYNAGQQEFDNWYHWEIGAPRGILEAATLLRSQLPDDLRTGLTDAVEHFIPDPGYLYPPDSPHHHVATGSNRLFTSQNVAYAGALARKGERIKLASDTSIGAIAINTQGSGDGYYFDGSYLAHINIPYTASYGRGLLTASSYLLAGIGGTQWDIPHSAIHPLRRAIARNFIPWLVNAQNLPPVEGRNLGNGNLLGAWMMGSILMLAEGAPDDQAALWHGYIKGHLERNTVYNFFEERTLPEALLAQRLLSSSVEALPEDLGPKIFPQMDRILARGKGWCFNLATASSRTRGYETMSHENIKGWHQGSAARYLYVDNDQEQYINYFPTLDPFRYAGTTIDSQELTYYANSKPTPFSFVGGSAIGGNKLDDGFYDRPKYATWVMQLGSADTTMTAKLSWFFLGNRIVHLGADIEGGSGAPIETILENRALKTPDMRTLYINGNRVHGAEQVGWQSLGSQVSSFTIPGAASVAMLGEPATIHFKHDLRSGAFSDLSPNRGSHTVHTNEFYTVWLDHGPKPDGARFSYMYLPLTTASEAQQEAQNPELQVLRNDADVQAVRDSRTGVTAANFHQAATIRTGPLVVSGAEETSLIAMEQVGQSGRSWRIGMSEPTQSRDERSFGLHLPPGLSKRVQVLGADSSVTVKRAGNALIVTIDTSELDGRTQHIEVGWRRAANSLRQGESHLQTT